MRTYQTAATGRIPAPPARVYAVLADYRVGHPAILPKPYFRALQVEQGGTGAGTVIRVEMAALGAPRVFRQAVTEPEPGRVLVERNLDGAAETTFTVDAADGGIATNLTISTELPSRTGLAGVFDRWMTTWYLQRVYRAEMALLAAYVGEHS